ncbi:MAG: DsbA family protein [Limisphaerales bacterium]
MNGHVAPHLATAVTRRDHIRGPANAPVTLVEYGDFECPYCSQAHTILQAIEEQMGDQLRFVFRHFPLTNMHPHAEHAAEAAEAAGAQGRFWEMHDLLFENQDALDDRDLVNYAAELGLDAKRVASDIVSGVHEHRIRQDFISGMRSDVNGTPTFFINNTRYDGEFDGDSMLEALQAEL